MLEFAIIAGLIVLGGLGLVVWLRMTSEWAERDQLRRFQEAMRAAGMSRPLPDKEED